MNKTELPYYLIYKKHTVTSVSGSLPEKSNGEDTEVKV